jgi:hypothetical protein
MHNHQLFAEAYNDELRAAKIAGDDIGACWQAFGRGRNVFAKTEFHYLGPSIEAISAHGG